MQISKGGFIRSASLEDGKAVQAIYAPYVEHTVISFETTVPSEAEMTTRIQKTLPNYPFLVYEQDKKVIGYAYASQHRTREAYRWSVDSAAYVHPDFLRQGIGRKLYLALLTQLELLGYANVFAGIALPNPASVALHETCGFESIGIYRKVGFKLGAWHDVGWWQKTLNHPANPVEPKPNSK